MRIISGKKRGATLIAPKGQITRPTADRTREMIFNVLNGGRHGEVLEAPLVVDAFAGSGAMGLEAWSRGAKRVIMIDHDRLARSAITANIQKLNASEACGAVDRDLSKPMTWPFGAAGLLFLDPPWRRSADEADLSEIALEQLVEAKAVLPEAFAVIEYDVRFPPHPPTGWAIVDMRKAGRAGVMFLRYQSN